MCEGLGSVEEFDPELVLPNPALSVADDAVDPWKSLRPATRKKQMKLIEPFLLAHQADLQTPLQDLKPQVLHQLFHGDDRKFLGLEMLLEKEYSTATRKNDHVGRHQIIQQADRVDDFRRRPIPLNARRNHFKWKVRKAALSDIDEIAYSGTGWR